ncbi:hypothetical protein PENANT_c023G07838 [Penicillium antarcticum]|uniref:Cell wall proline rich protein n=1 Tax=Penicillium antarcticum TaxID=416450 RepID=A0A1V6Q0I3_9EURO|nr:uncharacterized protein N7508_006189 [Penicillium antarcticum]KAJ5301326.1 hypothetical protein N7508_006189 [Penicillium antarcticum]OQD82206.1 hypothetical protein PENANT_c023G07838 [Penicillium antarcticum]
MASISLPPSQGFPHFDPQSNAPGNRHSMGTPLPNPPFVFPARDPDAPETQSETLERRERPALPAFSFNPGSEQSLHLSAPSISNRAGGHRRRPSEFVGGDHLVTPETVGGDKREEPSVAAQPGLPPPGPGVGRVPGRRNHAHRRSAAISNVDLNAITKALGPNTGAGSAPCTPADPQHKSTIESPARPVSQSGMSLGRPTPPASPQFPPSPSIPPVPPIPAALQAEVALNIQAPEAGRPVSAISHETSDSAATIKFQQLEKPAFTDRVTPRPHRKPKARPKTADASLAIDFMQMDDPAGVSSIKRSHSAAGHSRARKSKSTPHLDSTLSPDDAHSTDHSRPSISDDGSETSDDEATENTTCDKSNSKSKKKKQKRVRSWAGSILTRTKSKSKRHAKQDKHDKHEKHDKHDKHDKKEEKQEAEDKPPVPRALAPRPPALTRTNSEAGSALDVDFDNDDVVVIQTPTNPTMPPSALEPVRNDRPSVPPVSTLETSWKPRSFYEQETGPHDNILSSPIIDLDAALGPFNTPDMRPSDQGANNNNFSVATQRMYSGGRRGEFVGPEMRYHRRAESAPVMPPFDRSALGAFRLGPNNTVETPDVFDEEEEDAFLAASQSPKNERAPALISPAKKATIPTSEDDKKSVHSNDTSDTEDTTRAPAASNPPETPETPANAGLGIRPTDQFANNRESEQTPAVNETQIVSNPFTSKPRSPVEILRAEEPASSGMGPPSPDVSPRFLAVDKRPSTSPVELIPSIPPFSLHPGVSPSESSFPSPDAPRSIAASSMTDRHFSHSYHHLPSDYPYASVEDVPSLTSSASTMTNTLNRFSAASFFPRARLSTDRAASFSGAGTRRTSQANASKRTSLASLSKLVGGPHTERSKLNQEEKPPGDASEKSRKKGRRLSRLMHFWKVKDKEKPSTEAAANERPQS